MLFKILSIYHGWFEVDFNRGWPLTNSDYLGCDAPYLLLEALGDLLEGKITEAWLCWQDEPIARILNLEKQNDKLIVKIYATGKESYDLDYNGITLSKHITDCLFTTEGELRDSAKSILKEFELYENGNGRQRYDVNWGDFPQQQYERLKKLLLTK
ncbi:MAG: hypothetical protein FWB96_13575 [Defluviitaleaceae bacterium]|nr:hypothetical protein [Defluviitaleaceae bacterium]